LAIPKRNLKKRSLQDPFLDQQVPVDSHRETGEAQLQVKGTFEFAACPQVASVEYGHSNRPQLSLNPIVAVSV
jgi:hypothetical protein